MNTILELWCGTCRGQCAVPIIRRLWWVDITHTYVKGSIWQRPLLRFQRAALILTVQNVTLYRFSSLKLKLPPFYIGLPRLRVRSERDCCLAWLYKSSTSFKWKTKPKHWQEHVINSRTLFFNLLLSLSVQNKGFCNNFTKKTKKK